MKKKKLKKKTKKVLKICDESAVQHFSYFGEKNVKDMPLNSEQYRLSVFVMFIGCIQLHIAHTVTGIGIFKIQIPSHALNKIQQRSECKASLKQKQKKK